MKSCGYSLSVQIIEQNHTSIFQYFLLLFTVALLFQIKHSLDRAFLQTTQRMGGALLALLVPV